MLPPRLSRAALAAALTTALTTTALIGGAVAPAQAAPVAPPSPPVSDVADHSLRAPVTNENFYFVMADRFANGTTANDTGGLGSNRLVSGFDPTSKGFYNGGDLKGLTSKVDYIKGLGTTAIWLTPSFKNKAVQLEDGPSAGYHGYWITDFTRIDPHLGTNADLKSLISAAHQRGMKVYFDIITNHTADVISYEPKARMPYITKALFPYKDANGNAFDDKAYAGTNTFPPLDPAVSFPYRPILDPAETNLKVPAWLNDVTNYHNRGDTTYQGENSTYGDFSGLDDLFTEKPQVVNGMMDIYETWIKDFGVDGFRIDTMKHVNDEFWQTFGPKVLQFAHEAGKSQFFMFGEVFDTSRDFTSRYTTTNKMQSVLDFPFQDAARNYASKGTSAADLQTFFAGDDWYTDADSNVYQLPTFLGNHDMGRIGSFIQADNAGAGDGVWLAKDRLAHELMYFSRGNPVVYYGDEQGFTGPGGDQSARQTMFASKVPEYLTDDLIGTTATHAKDNYVTTHPLYRSIAELSALTKQYPALRNGAHQNRYADTGPGIYAFSRIDRATQREYVVVLNNSTTAKTAPITTFLPRSSFTRIYGSGPKLAFSNGGGSVRLGAPALSATVYASNGRILPSHVAPTAQISAVETAGADHTRLNVRADVAGSSFYEVTFQARTPGKDWQNIGTDDTAPYQVFHDTSALTPGTGVEYRALVLDNARHVSTSAPAAGTVPTPVTPAPTGPVQTPEPTNVAVAGSLDSEIGCAGDWDPACDQAQMTKDPATGLWKLTVTLPAGDYEYKAALNKKWDENYGDGGAPNGGNIALHVAATRSVTFTYDHATHIISNN
ncbi:alpha-amylase family glycosyl hydrolase [Tersicoccus sp. Bi-70]|uniref:alpha-amylase family glycosyl hydrolase n=1 Tax=Tersicoccus sp. Bi-70 TaxID=1897634 RepID=UPI0009769C2B|nr:alpha-amylase family glycosyl hydrolase [Tersicoccus sp. Bi-70]OMH32288.1 alpha-amylase [Tersicoccus sp. Bi-70]